MKSLLILITMFAVHAQANKDGLTRVVLSHREVRVQLSAAEISFECTATDSWDQSDLTLHYKGLATNSYFKIESITAILNGDCEPVKQKILDKFSAAGGALPITIRYELFDDTVWGISSEGTPYENRYCKRYKHELVNLFGLTEQGDYFQSMQELLTEELPYEVCSRPSP